jgi:ribulose-phosphate 3-epimerase
MKQSPIIAPSILSADFARLGEQVSEVLDAGAQWVHFDVMDNHYVPNLTVGPMVCASLRSYGIKAPLDVHLMVEPVDELARAFADAGASTISFHPDATRHLDRSLQLIRDLCCAPGLALNPGTDESVLRYVWDAVDLVLLMSVNPGFGGQAFIPKVLSKISAVRQELDARNSSARLQVDGGVSAANIAQIAEAGADTFVVGSQVFHHKNPAMRVRELQGKLG